MKTMPRTKTHWCADKKHDKCGGKVYSYKNNRESKDVGAALARTDLIGSCKCECHIERLSNEQHI